MIQLLLLVVGLHEAAYQTTTVEPYNPHHHQAPGGGVCHDSYYQCDDYNPCYEKEICVQGCCVNATCPGPEYYCFSNGEYQCYEDEICGPQSGCCEKYTAGQMGGQKGGQAAAAAYTTTEPPYNPNQQYYQTTAPPYVYNHHAYLTTEPPYNPHQAGQPQTHNMGHRPTHHGMGHGQGHGAAHAPQHAAPTCDAYYHCTSIADCWEGETCTNGCCTQAV